MSMQGYFLTMTNYDESFKGINVIYDSENIKDTLGEILEKNNKSQIRIAETEKYPHVTFFFNGGSEAICNGETRIMIPSPKVSTYDLKPEMSAKEVEFQLIKAIKQNIYDYAFTYDFIAPVYLDTNASICICPAMSSTVLEPT